MRPLYYIVLFVFLLNSCSDDYRSNRVDEYNYTEDDNNTNDGDDNNNDDDSTTDDDTNSTANIKLLSLGDSYTIGASVCDDCKFPSQLRDSLLENKNIEEVSLKVIARTGWTTTNLMNAINSENLSNDYDLVTLLIGVNNQYQSKDFSIYEEEFPQLVQTAIRLAKVNLSKVIVVSIPDYAYTPFGRGNTAISAEIDKYNNFAQTYCNSNRISFVNITDITREGLANPNLVASDGLHPSTEAYTEFVKRILPLAKEKLGF